MCNCLNMVRDPVVELAEQPRMPMSKHHPACEDYQLLDFVRVEYDGASCICTPAEAAEFSDGETQTPIRLTADQFEALPEFGGF